MRWFRDLITVVLVLLVLAVSAVGLMVEFPKFGGVFDRVSDTGRGIVSAWRPGYGLFFLWLGLLCGTLLVLLLTVLVRRKRMHVEVETADGRVCILDAAIKRYVQSALARVPGVMTRRVLLRHGRRGLLVEIYVLVRSHERLIDLKQQLIDRARKALTEDLGITSLGGIDVLIEDFEVRQKTEPVPVAAPSPAAAAPVVPATVAESVPTAIEESPFIAPRRSAFASEPEAVPVVPEPAVDASPPTPEAAPTVQAPARSRGLFGRWRRSEAASGETAEVTVEAEPPAQRTVDEGAISDADSSDSTAGQPPSDSSSSSKEGAQ
jgi:hypothetical protein